MRRVGAALSRPHPWSLGVSQELADALLSIDVDLPADLRAATAMVGGSGAAALPPSAPAGGASRGYDFAAFRDLTLQQLTAVASGAPGRYYVLVSLAEAEALRGAIHVALHSVQGMGLGGTRLGLHAHAQLLDASPGFERAGDYETHVARQCSRFVDSEAEYSERDAIALLRALRSSHAAARKTWFVDVRACRRRQQQAAQFAGDAGAEKRRLLRRRRPREGVPVALEALFTAADEFAMLEESALLRRVRGLLMARGLSARDAFAIFDRNRSASLSCSDVASGLQWLGLRLSVPQIHDLVRAVDLGGEGEVVLDDFKVAFAPRDGDRPSPTLITAPGDSSASASASAAAAAGARTDILADLLGGPAPPPDLLVFGAGSDGGVSALSGGVEELQKNLPNVTVPELGPVGGRGPGAGNESRVDLRGFEVRVRDATSFQEVWAVSGHGAGTWSEPAVSIWAPPPDAAGLGKATMRVCIGHYPSTVGNPAKAKGTPRRKILELASTGSSVLGGLGAADKFAEVARVAMPHPRRYKLVWSTLVAGKPLFVWRPVAPSADYVALGLLATTTDTPPPESAVHCVPRSWCELTHARPPKRVAEAGGQGGQSKPGALWVVNHAMLLGATQGRNPPEEDFYDLRKTSFPLGPT